MATNHDTYVVAWVLSNHFTANPAIQARYFHDAEFHSRVHLFSQLMREMCAAARRNGVPRDTVESMLAEIITECVTL
jgi:hypothetical protein